MLLGVVAGVHSRSARCFDDTKTDSRFERDIEFRYCTVYTMYYNRGIDLAANTG